jgi:pyruvate dehydrogenase E2 component (dihydrolipoamide acetyltransferase)
VSEEEASPQATKVSEFQSEERILASPAARRLAREHDVDLAIVKGSGPEGRIDEDDVKRVIGDRGRVSPRIKQLIPLSGLKKTSAERVSMSFRTAPHSTIVMEVDVSEAAELHKKTGVSYTAIILKAAANTLKEVPLINSTLEDNKIKVFEDANIGVAVATENGLIVPVVHESDQKRVKEIDLIIKELTEKARGGRLSKEELTGGTFTISNLGMYGVDFFTPIINPPEGAILGVGRVNEKPVAIGTNIKIKPVIMLSLSYDHRIIDGAPAAEFLQKTKEKIERPNDL